MGGSSCAPSDFLAGAEVGIWEADVGAAELDGRVDLRGITRPGPIEVREFSVEVLTGAKGALLLIV